jgi:hypothetical protein
MRATSRSGCRSGRSPASAALPCPPPATSHLRGRGNSLRAPPPADPVSATPCQFGGPAPRGTVWLRPHSLRCCPTLDPAWRGLDAIPPCGMPRAAALGVPHLPSWQAVGLSARAGCASGGPLLGVHDAAGADQRLTVPRARHQPEWSVRLCMKLQVTPETAQCRRSLPLSHVAREALSVAQGEYVAHSLWAQPWECP